MKKNIVWLAILALFPIVGFTVVAQQETTQNQIRANNQINDHPLGIPQFAGQLKDNSDVQKVMAALQAGKGGGKKAYPRGLKPTPRHVLASAPRFKPAGISAPPYIMMIPPKLSMWGNSQYGDCVSASEAARIAAFSVYCGLPETFIPEATVISWAGKYGYLNGALLPDVMTTRMTNGMIADDGKTYLAGQYGTVNYADPEALKAALVIGPVNLGIDANALSNDAGNNQGWFSFGGSPGQYQNEDHCVPLLGYGKTVDLCAGLSKAFNVTITPPANAPTDGYFLFTWSTIGIVDQAWIMSTCGEAWVQNPTNVGQSPGPPPPPPPPVCPPGFHPDPVTGQCVPDGPPPPPPGNTITFTVPGYSYTTPGTSFSVPSGLFGRRSSTVTIPGENVNVQPYTVTVPYTLNQRGK